MVGKLRIITPKDKVISLNLNTSLPIWSCLYTQMNPPKGYFNVVKWEGVMSDDVKAILDGSSYEFDRLETKQSGKTYLHIKHKTSKWERQFCEGEYIIRNLRSEVYSLGRKSFETNQFQKVK